MRIAILLIIPLFLLSGCFLDDDVADTYQGPPALDDTALKEYAPFPVGVGANTDQLSVFEHKILIRSEFNSITAEREMYQNALNPTEGEYFWTAADEIVNFADENEMRVHGAALLWDEKTPGWLKDFAGDSTQFEGILESYITTVITHFGTKVNSWDVVNEPLDDSGELTNNLFTQRLGAAYIARAFQYAKNANPDALLFINERGLFDNQVKQEAFLDLLDGLIADGVPIDGVGIQSHLRFDSPSKAQIDALLDEIKNRGLKVHLSELDISINPDKDINYPNATRLQAQEQRMQEVVDAFTDLPVANQYGITVWGLIDSDSWIIRELNRNEWPLLFDALYQAKPMYQGFLDGINP